MQLTNSHDVQVQKIQVLPKQNILIEDNHSLQSLPFQYMEEI
jgi:hypothetical protein